MQISGVDNRCSLVKSFQGEGPFAGQRIVILRFIGCNLECNWQTADGSRALCDTAWTWDGSSKGDTWDVDELVEKIVSESKKKLLPAKWEQKGWLASREQAKIVMVTGGEPTLRQNSEAFQDLIEKLRAEGLQVHYESNATQTPNQWLIDNTDVFVLSPKYQLYPEKYNPTLIDMWQKTGVRTVWKFVVGRMADMDELRTWLEQMHVDKNAEVWLLPLTRPGADGVYRDMGQAMDVLGHGGEEAFRILGYQHVKLSPRLQVSEGFK